MMINNFINLYELYLQCTELFVNYVIDILKCYSM